LGQIAEVIYSQQGRTKKFDEVGFNYTRRINFIEIPYVIRV
jgi:hypothetical protein